jgi:hypothetical protein
MHNLLATCFQHYQYKMPTPRHPSPLSLSLTHTHTHIRNSQHKNMNNVVYSSYDKHVISQQSSVVKRDNNGIVRKTSTVHTRNLSLLNSAVWLKGTTTLRVLELKNVSLQY